MLSGSHIEKYVAEDGEKCLYCGSGQLSISRYEGKGATIRCQVKCDGCQKMWFDVFRLAGIEEAAPDLWLEGTNLDPKEKEERA